MACFAAADYRVQDEIWELERRMKIGPFMVGSLTFLTWLAVLGAAPLNLFNELGFTVEQRVEWGWILVMAAAGMVYARAMVNRYETWRVRWVFREDLASGAVVQVGPEFCARSCEMYEWAGCSTTTGYCAYARPSATMTTACKHN